MAVAATVGTSAIGPTPLARRAPCYTSRLCQRTMNAHGSQSSGWRREEGVRTHGHWSWKRCVARANSARGSALMMLHVPAAAGTAQTPKQIEAGADTQATRCRRRAAMASSHQPGGHHAPSPRRASAKSSSAGPNHLEGDWARGGRWSRSQVACGILAAKSGIGEECNSRWTSHRSVARREPTSLAAPSLHTCEPLGAACPPLPRRSDFHGHGCYSSSRSRSPTA